MSIDQARKIFDSYEGHKITKELVEEIAYSSQKNMSFKEAQESIKRYFDLDISESVITQIAENIGNKVYKNDIEKAENVHENFEQLIPDVKENDKEKCNLNILVDGSMLSIKTQEGLCWKEMKLGMVYKDNNKIKMTNGKNIITEKDYVAYLGSPDKFRQLLLNSAIKNGYGRTENTVFIADGAKWLWNICEDLFPDAIQILDYYHLSENVYKYANLLYPDKEKEMVKWAETVLKDIKEGRIDDVIDSLPDINYNNKDSKQAIPNLKGYLQNNRNRVNYKEYKNKGFSIGSGAVESGNKKVIQQRLKQSGMHWSHSGGQNIASLRVKYCSNKWDEVENIIHNAA